MPIRTRKKRSRFQIALPDIRRTFNELRNRVLRRSEINDILADNRPQWKLPENITVTEFIKRLVDLGDLSKIQFPFPGRTINLYVWGAVPPYEIVQQLKPNGYFSHFTAMYLHGLTQQIPKRIYLNHEQSIKPKNRNSLTQHGIDLAFQRKPRTTNNVAAFQDGSVVLLNGMNTDNLGVVTETFDHGHVAVTNLERTMIDICVRPSYAGGIYEVLKAYTAAAERISVNRISAMLKKLDFVYPYHQAIGFLLERAGLSPAKLKLLDKFPKTFDFYLDYQMKEKVFSSKWRLYHPKGF